MNKYFFIFLLTCISCNLLAADHLLFFGAGGEDGQKPDTIFDEDIKTVGDYTKRNPNLNVTVSIVDNHSTTNEIVSTAFSANTNKTKFSTTEFDRLIESYKTKISSMSNGDQLMIYIDSHGAENTDPNTKSHQIASTNGIANLNTLKGVDTVNLDKLIELKTLAKAKKVKLAIIDASCFSGNTLNLADENTCVISSSGPRHYSYVGFGSSFFKALEKGKNLEEIFLKVRQEEGNPNFPMISTPIGVAINTLLYKQMTPFFYTNEPDQNKLMPFLIANSDPYNQCLLKENYNSLIDTINRLEELSLVTEKTIWKSKQIEGLDLTNLKKLLTAYQKLLLTGAKKMNNIGVKQLEKIETFNIEGSTVGTFFSKKSSHKYSWKDLITTDFKKLSDEAKTMIENEKSPLKKLDYLDNYNLYQAAQIKKDQILLSYPKLGKDITRQENEISDAIKDTYSLARKIANEERKLYTALYKGSQGIQNPSINNACQNFKL